MVWSLELILCVVDWVVWVEGEYACPAAQVLAQLDESPCGQNFTLAEGEWQLGGCEGDDFEPKELRQSNGIDKVHDCKGDSDKITCRKVPHRPGVCTELYTGSISCF